MVRRMCDCAPAGGSNMCCQCSWSGSNAALSVRLRVLLFGCTPILFANTVISRPLTKTIPTSTFAKLQQNWFKSGFLHILDPFAQSQGLLSQCLGRQTGYLENINHRLMYFVKSIVFLSAWRLGRLHFQPSFPSTKVHLGNDGDYRFPFVCIGQRSRD